MKKLTPLFSLLLLTAIFFSSIPTAKACGPSFLTPVFAFETRSENFADFARGRLGIVQQGFSRGHLFAAYRYFNGGTFSVSEQKDLIAVWTAQYENADPNETGNTEAVKSWLQTRKKVLPTEPEPKIYTEREYEGGYSFFPNCNKNAFETAGKTLENRLASYGLTEDLKSWVKAQDTVFYNCSEGKEMPAEVAANAPAWLKNDRDYQIAAANFYATNFDEARTRFEKIAANRDSVWSKIANYLVARTLIRQASLLDDENAEQLAAKRKPFYEQAEAKLRSIIADDNQSEYHEAAHKLLNLTAYRLHPNERKTELAQILTNTAENKNLRQDLIDYTWLLDKTASVAFEKAETAAVEKAKQDGKEYNYDYSLKFTDLPNDFRQDDLTDWLFAYQTVNDKAAYTHSLEKWKSTNSLAWFVAAISKAEKDSPEVSQLLSKVGQIETNHPAFATVAFHQIRLMTANGQQTEARQKLDTILSDKNLRLSARNQFSSQRMMLAQNLDEFLRFAQRRATVFAYDGSPYEVSDMAPPKEGQDYYKEERAWLSRQMFDEDSARIFNEQMPLSMLKQAVNSPQLPDYLKRKVAIAAWTKAVLLNKDADAQQFAPSLAKYAPELLSVFGQYQRARTPLERENAATYLLLKLPALRPFVESSYGRLTAPTEIDSFRDNWWCAPRDTYTDANGNEQPILKSTDAPTFLTAAQLAEAERERQQLKQLGNSSTVLARRAVEFAQKSPNDSRLAESLHLAVRSTRYGCTDCATGRYSKAAHDLLKKRFPNSEWAKKTPYWFKDDSCEKQP
jgi:hypothetical protein